MFREIPGITSVENYPKLTYLFNYMLLVSKVANSGYIGVFNCD